MATNKHATIRYQALDKCFRNTGRDYDIDALVDACNNAIYEFTGKNESIKKRSVYSDIVFMESEQGWSIPLERIKDGRKVYFKYSDKNFSINSQPLNAAEESQLKEALLTLTRFKGMPHFEWVDELTARLDSGLGLSGNSETVIEFEQNKYLKGLEFITPIYTAIINKKVLSIEYNSFKSSPQHTIVLHPYFLKQYNNRWYVFGKNDSNEFVINLSLDRIIQIEPNKKKYAANKSIDFNEYFEDIVGVTLMSDQKIEHIVLKVSESLLPYIETKPLHGSQKIKRKEKDYSIISLELIPNYELESLILSFGEGLVVLEPSKLKKRLKTRLDLMISNYKKELSN